MEQGISALATALISPALASPPMIAAWILVGIGCCVVTTLVYVAARSRTRPIDLDQAVEAFRSLDIEAFRNLTDDAEEAFLRDRLPPGKFREIKRQRAWAALIYAREAGRAAAALALVGQAAQRSADPRIAASGVQLAENAFRLRLQTMGAGLRLLTGVLLPGVPSRSLPSLADQYEQSAETLFRLTRFSSRGGGLVSSESA
ncbi:MAG: hypothetical protein ABSD75_10025 [Terriglobales bacterium]|jgi:hypothetical protein